MADITIMKTPAETGLAQLFESLKGSLPGDLSVRETAMAGFAERGLPHRRIEEFKYTDLRALLREAAPFAEKPGSAELAVAFNHAKAFTGLAAARLTIVNGHVATELSEATAFPAGVEVASMNEALARGHALLGWLGAVEAARGNPVYELNTAFMADGAVIRIPAGTAVEQPLHLRFVNSGSQAFATATRVLVVVEEGASVTVLESHEGPDGLACQPNDVIEFVVGDRARVRHVRLNAEGRDALALSTLTARLGAEVSFNTINVVSGAQVSRHQVFVTFAGENSTARIDGANLLRGRQHADATLLVDHAVPHCTSRELYKTVIDDEATGIFQGKIIVRPDAQKTDGGMKSDALLLSERATMNNKPELEIFADDVVCGHGATCGALDEDLLFYLRSRGLPAAEAESLLLQAFLGQAVETVENEAVHDALVEVVEGWLQARH
ncbi:Fe-S cluster assembly protein SufD [Enterovirga aerilata]|uniref:Fe-S cluster assembly protein SufD n=1 Tax=Enterovirga aerilata TaxID=2730920 RepID=A0A849IHE4_9HYPH|nr:Fe-S cluster assembly protein SufD [Enterovirga sp. DB1703]NNM73343.1 Fe-S cluster assembly protein SufD [Enterovirga sp. DB1703]